MRCEAEIALTFAPLAASRFVGATTPEHPADGNSEGMTLASRALAMEVRTGTARVPGTNRNLVGAT